MLVVTPLAGVWIEISCWGMSRQEASSLPLRECGLKLRIHRNSHFCLKSLPLRECGLKFEEMINCFKIMGRLWRCYLKGF